MVSDVSTCHKDKLMIVTVVKGMKFLLVNDLDDEWEVKMGWNGVKMGWNGNKINKMKSIRAS